MLQRAEEFIEKGKRGVIVSTPLLQLMLYETRYQEKEAMAGTITVDIDALTALVQYLQFLKQVLDNEKSLIPSLNAQLTEAIKGTAPAIAQFDGMFSGWIQILNTITTDIDSAYATLHGVLIDTQDAVNTL